MVVGQKVCRTTQYVESKRPGREWDPDPQTHSTHSADFNCESYRTGGNRFVDTQTQANARVRLSGPDGSGTRPATG